MSFSMGENQDIVFFDNKTLQPAANGEEASSEGFFIGKDGKVYEFIEQGYADFHAMIERPDVSWAIVESDANEPNTTEEATMT